MDDPRRIALHEAAHPCIAHRLGVYVVSVGTASARARSFLAMGRPDLDQVDERYLLDMATMVLAGPIASTMCAPFPSLDEALTHFALRLTSRKPGPPSADQRLASG
jgi:hypothetical protein